MIPLPPLNLQLATTVTSGVNQNGANFAIGQGDWNVNLAATNSHGSIAAAQGAFGLLPIIALAALAWALTK